MGQKSDRTFLVLLSLVAALSQMLPAPATAFVAEDLARFQKERRCIGCDLRGVDFRGMDLRAVVLEGTLLVGANLQGVNLEDAFLEDANLQDVNISAAVLSGAGLDGATWIDGRACEQDSVGTCK